jgi:hypothetical protein
MRTIAVVIVVIIKKEKYRRRSKRVKHKKFKAGTN